MNQDSLNIEISPKFKEAIDAMNGDEPAVFITGKAGTGKSTLLTYFRESSGKNLVVLAPTGVAAVNVKGETIHSFFHFKPGVTMQDVSKVRKPELYNHLTTIIIDEVSMVRADLLDCVDRFLRLNRGIDKPFGGVQMIFIGDLYQLPPVITKDEEAAYYQLYTSPYFFDSYVMKQLPIKIIELDKIYRQGNDLKFIELLNLVRNNQANTDHIAELNERVNRKFEPDYQDQHIYLTSTNKLASELNEKMLDKLYSDQIMFNAFIWGDFDPKMAPVDEELFIKPGAQIMMANNDSEGRWINGTLGRVLDLQFDDFADAKIIVQLADGEEVNVSRNKWDLYRYKYDEESKSLISEVVGSFEQFPIKLAWGITIHKSQGKTFDKVVIDLGWGAFAHGQVYVALSRCRSLEGVVLKRPIKMSDIRVDRRVIEWSSGEIRGGLL